ncbi:L-rhamnose isomerase [Shigella flexneri]
MTGGIQATGNYSGKARNASELRADLNGYAAISGPKRLNLHAIYPESDTPARAIRSTQSTSKTGLNGRKPISSVFD